METGVVRDSRGTPRARWLFSSRENGVSQGSFASLNVATHVGDDVTLVSKNRSILESAFQCPIVYADPVHGLDIVEVDQPTQTVKNADIAFTRRRQLGLASLAADCVPLVMVDRDFKWVASAHLGWRGCAQDSFSQFETIVDSWRNVVVLLGPAICGDCYVVDEVTRSAVAQHLPDAQTQNGLDLRIGLQKKFQERGAQCEIVGSCVFEDERYFSYRREGVTGRQAGIVALL